MQCVSACHSPIQLSHHLQRLAPTTKFGVAASIPKFPIDVPISKIPTAIRCRLRLAATSGSSSDWSGAVASSINDKATKCASDKLRPIRTHQPKPKKVKKNSNVT